MTKYIFRKPTTIEVKKQVLEIGHDYTNAETGESIKQSKTGVEVIDCTNTNTTKFSALNLDEEKIQKARQHADEMFALLS